MVGAYFWQLTGNSGHVFYDWRTDTSDIAEIIFDNFAGKDKNGVFHLQLILGIKESGASHLLIPCNWYLPNSKKGNHNPLTSVQWKRGEPEPYAASQYASLSPIQIDSVLWLQELLEERRNVSKVTKASKAKIDTSKANGRFHFGLPDPTRAAFEHARCVWRIRHNKLNPVDYGLPPAPWNNNLVIFSLALNFWQPDQVKVETEYLLNAAVAKLSLPCNENEEAESVIFHFNIEENLLLRNPFQIENEPKPRLWKTKTLPEEQVSREIQRVIDDESTINGQLVVPVLILVHRYEPWLQQELSRRHLKPSEWNNNIQQLLGRVQPYRQCKEENGDISQSPAVYVIDVLEAFKTVSGWHPSTRVRPVETYSKITGQNHPETGFAGSDANYILQSWKRLAEGPSVIDQIGIFRGNDIGGSDDITNMAGEHALIVETAWPEDPGLFSPDPSAIELEEASTSRNAFSSDSEDGYEY